MKKILLIALLLTFATGTALAQGQPGGQGSGGPGSGGNGTPANAAGGNFGNPGNPVDRLTEQLGLDAAQVAAITAIFEESQLQRDVERARAHAADCENRAITHELILAELTDDQVLLYEELQQRREELRQAMEEVRQAHGGGGYGGGRGMMDCGS